MNFRSIHCVPAFVIAVLNAVILTPFAVLLKDELENSSCELTPRGKSPLRTNWAFQACTSQVGHVRRSKPGFVKQECSEIGPQNRVFVILHTEVRCSGVVGYDFGAS